MQSHTASNAIALNRPGPGLLEVLAPILDLGPGPGEDAGLWWNRLRRLQALLLMAWGSGAEGLGERFRQRWGVEVFFRQAKQTLQARRLRARSPALARLELGALVAGLAALGLLQRRAIEARGQAPDRACARPRPGRSAWPAASAKRPEAVHGVEWHPRTGDVGRGRRRVGGWQDTGGAPEGGHAGRLTGSPEPGRACMEFFVGVTG